MRKLICVALSIAFFSSSLAMAQLRQLKLVMQAVDRSAGTTWAMEETFLLKDSAGKVLQKISAVGNGADDLTSTFSKLSGSGTITEIITAKGMSLQLQKDGYYFAKSANQNEIQNLAGRLPKLKLKCTFSGGSASEWIPVSPRMGSFLKSSSLTNGRFVLNVPIGVSEAELEAALQRFVGSSDDLFYVMQGRGVFPVKGGLPKSIEGFETIVKVAGYRPIQLDRGWLPSDVDLQGMLVRFKYCGKSGQVEELSGKVTQQFGSQWFTVVQSTGKSLTLQSNQVTLLAIGTKAAKP